MLISSTEIFFFFLSRTADGWSGKGRVTSWSSVFLGFASINLVGWSFSNSSA